MRRLAVLPAAVLVVAAGAACGASDGSAVETLPPIRTTSTISTTSTTINTDRIFYTVKRGDNLNLIASSFEVPLQALIDLNRSVISDPDNVPAGVTLEIPTGIQLVDELPTPQTTTEP
jgi:LysM repeat protein